MLRCYKELIRLPTFEERFKYLQLHGTVGAETFGYDRYLNQMLYHSDNWKDIRQIVIIRDNGCDLGCEDRPLYSRIIIHHMNPITLEDITSNSKYLLDPNYLVVTSITTHNAIHYGDESLLPKGPVERRPNDTCPWR